MDISIQQPPDTLGYGGMFSQNLGVTPEQLQRLPDPNYHTDGLYVLTFSVQNQDGPYPGYYTAKLSFGSQELGEISGWATRSFDQITLNCPSPSHIVVDNSEPGGGPPQGKFNLVVTWSVDVWPIYFRKVSLTFTPQA